VNLSVRMIQFLPIPGKNKPLNAHNAILRPAAFSKHAVVLLGTGTVIAGYRAYRFAVRRVFVNLESTPLKA
jgi:hypothetical protein